jgi:DNA polymerase III subunit gamma/tau
VWTTPASCAIGARSRLPARGGKVYILDEVHMASTAAFNALLKLIEEPPGHVLFAMATTDPQKVLPTILSRVQRLDLRRVDAEAVAGQVRQICEAEGYRIADDAVDAVVRAGDGSLRDTLSVLEQVLAFAGTDVTGDAVAQVIGRTPDDLVEDVVARLATHDVAGLLAAVQRLVDEGHDLRRFTLDLAQHVRDLLVLRVAPAHPDLVDATAERRQRLAAGAADADPDVLIRTLEVLGATVIEQRQTAPRLPLELALARLAVVERLSDSSAAPVQESVSAGAPSPVEGRRRSRWRRCETRWPRRSRTGCRSRRRRSRTGCRTRWPRRSRRQPTRFRWTPRPPSPPRSPHAPRRRRRPSCPRPQTASDTGDDGDDLARVTAVWPAVLDTLKQHSRRCHALFDPAVVLRVGRGMLTLRYGRRYASFHAANARKAEFADVLRTAVRDHCGLDLRLEVVVEGEDDRRRPLPPSVTPDDARVPVLERPTPGSSHGGETADAPAEPDADSDELDVREAELAQAQSPTDVTELLAAELGAQLVEERPAPGE